MTKYPLINEYGEINWRYQPKDIVQKLVALGLARYDWYYNAYMSAPLTVKLVQEIAAFAHRTDDIRFTRIARLLKRFDTVIRFVKAGADQIVHSSVNDDEPFGTIAFFVKDLRQKIAGIRRQKPSGFTDDRHIQPLEGGENRLGVIIGGNRRLVVVPDPKPPSDIKKLEFDIDRMERTEQISDDYGRFVDRLKFSELASDMKMDADWIQVRRVFGQNIHPLLRVDLDAEFIVVQPCRDVRMGFRIDVGIDADTDACLFSKLTGDHLNPPEFRLALDIDVEDVGFNRFADLAIIFADTAEKDAVFRYARHQCTAHFPDRDTISARSQLREIGSARPLDWCVNPKLSRFHCQSPSSRPGRKLPNSSGM